MLVAALLVGAAAASELPVVRIGMVMDGPWEREAELRELFKREILALTRGEHDVRFPDKSFLLADWNLEGAQKAVDQLLADPETDLLITLGPLSCHLFCCRSELAKPVIAPVVLDTELQGIPRRGQGSGVRNLNYLVFPAQIEKELTAFRKVVPFDHVTLLISRGIYEAIPSLVSRGRQAALGLGLRLDFVPVGDSVDEALESLPQGTEAVLILPLFHLGNRGLENLVTGLIERRLPSFSVIGRAEVEKGILAGQGRDDYFERLARRVALNVQRILLGEAPESLPVDFIPRQELVINPATARTIGVSPRWEVLIEAQLVGEEETNGRLLTLHDAVREAVEVNLDLAARRREVAAGEQEVARARSVFKPQIEISALGLQIDDDRAAASLGSQAERSLTGSLGVSQLIFSEASRANRDIQAELQFQRELSWAELKLDIAAEAAVSYLDLLRAKTLLRVRRSNLELTRSNLELARLRRSIGEANPSEVYRWESAIAADRQALIATGAAVQQAEIALNRLLHRGLEEPFRTAEVDLEDPSLITGQERFTGYIETPRHFAALREFVVRDGLALAPELKQLDAAITAQKRQLAAARRAFWLPSVGLSFSLDELLVDDGAGSVANPGLPLPAADDRDWTLGLQASLPLFTGGARRAERLQAEETLARLEIERQAVTEKLEQRIRSAAIAARASSSSIDLSRQAAVAANKNLELIADAYARGVLSILELLDAQNAALNAELGAANAVYDFFIDLMTVQRATNRFDFFITPEIRDAWYERLDRFFAEVGVERYPSDD